MQLLDGHISHWNWLKINYTIACYRRILCSDAWMGEWMNKNVASAQQAKAQDKNSFNKAKICSAIEQGKWTATQYIDSAFKSIWKLL